MEDDKVIVLPYDKTWPEHEADCAAYADAKRRLAIQYEADRGGYTEAKSAAVWDILRRADRWSRKTGWMPGNSDA